MDDHPTRVQLRRTKGWRLPANTRKVDRSTAFGNPFVCTPHGCTRKPCDCCEAYRCCVDVFREWVASGVERRPSCTGSFSAGLDALAGYPARTALVERLPELRGKNLACWCALDAPCHADVLLELANREPAGRAALAQQGDTP